MIRRRIFRNAGMAVSQVVVSGIFLFALFHFLLRTIGPVQLGIWSLVLAAVSTARLSELGFAGGVVKFVARYSARSEPTNAAAVVQTAALSVAAFVGILLALLYPVLLWVLVFVVPPENFADAALLLPVALLSLWLGTIGSVAISALDGIQRIDIRSALTMASVALHFAIVVLLVPQYGLIGLAYAHVAQALITLVVSWIVVRGFLPLPAIAYKWNPALFREMVGYGLNLQLASLVQLMFDPVTKALLSKFGGLDSVSYYDMANRMIMQFRGLLVAANQVVVPVIGAMQETTPSSIRAIYTNSYKLLLFLAIPLYAGIAAALPVICELWVGHYERTFVTFAALLIGGWSLNTLVSPAYYSNVGTGRLFWNTVGHVVIGLMNLALGIVLGMLLGGLGVVIAYVAALASGSSLIVLDVHRQYQIRSADLLPRSYLPVLGAAALAIVLNLAIYHTFRHRYPIAVISLAGVLVYLGVMAPFLWGHPLRAKLMSLDRA